LSSHFPEPEPDESSAHDNTDDTAAGVSMSIEQVLDILENGTVDTDHGAIRWSSNYTFLTSVTHNDTTVMAVYKPRSGERPLWDFPDGTLCNRERAAFLTSEALGWQLVPPTVLRDGPRGIGSIQFFVDHDPNFNYFSFDESLLPQLMYLAAFDVLVNNADRKGGHCIVDTGNHVWGIDHGITFHSMHKLRTVIWNFAGNPIPHDILADVEALCMQIETQNSAFRQSLDELLNDREIAAFRRRIERMLKTACYPQPGPGPNYPWPPV
jgi:hypothetical protein